MTLNELFEKYLKFMWETFMYDADVFSKGWIYYWLLIPAFFYLMFFCIKWTLLLLPFYGLPLMVLKTIAYLFGGEKIKEKDKQEQA